MAKILQKNKSKTESPESSAPENNVGIARLFSILGLAGYVIFFFLGTVYVFNIIITGFVSAILLLLLFLVSNEFVRQKTKKRQYVNRKPEMVLAVFYLLLFLGSFVFAFHFIDISFARKDKLKIAGKQKLGKIKELESTYRRQVQIKTDNINTQVGTDSLAFFNNDKNRRQEPKENLKNLLGLDDDVFTGSNATIGERINREKTNLIRNTEANYKVVDKVFEKADKEYRKIKVVFDQWKSFDIRHEYNFHIDAVYAELYKKAKTQMPDFGHPDKITLTSIEIDSPVSTFKKADFAKKLGVSGGIALMYLLVLLPYILAKRPEPTHSGRIIRPENRKTSRDLGIKINKN